MSQLITYNWTPWTMAVQVNGINNTPWSPLKPSAAAYDYFPYSGQILRDLSQDHGAPNVWGKTNKLIIKFEETSGSLSFPGVQEPSDALIDVDLLLWVFPDRVVFSQRNRWLEEARPQE